MIFNIFCKNTYIKSLLSYLITLLILVVFCFLIYHTKEQKVFSVDTFITAMTLFTLVLQNIKSPKIRKYQKQVVSLISLETFFKNASVLFFILAFFIMPYLYYEYAFGQDKQTVKDIYVLSVLFFMEMIGAILIGKDIDKSTKNHKFALFYGILFVAYLVIKFSSQ